MTYLSIVFYKRFRHVCHSVKTQNVCNEDLEMLLASDVLTTSPQKILCRAITEILFSTLQLLGHHGLGRAWLIQQLCNIPEPQN